MKKEMKMKSNNQPDDKKETLKSFFWNLASKVATYFLILVLGNLYITSEYGKANFIMSIHTVVFLIALVGIPQAIISWVIKKKDYKSVFKILFFVSILSGVVLIVASFLVIKIFGYNKNLIYPMIVVGLAMVFYWANNVAASFAISKKKYSKVSLTAFLSITITLVLSILLKNLGGFGIVIAYMTGYSISALLLCYTERDDFLNVWKDSKIRSDIFWKYAKSGIFVSLTSLSFYFLSYTDSSILGLLSNFELVGKYGISSAFPGIVALIPFALSMFVLTRMSEIKSEKKSKETLRKVLKISYLSSFVIALFLSIFSHFILSIFFPRYLGIEPYISILLVGASFYSVYFLIYNYHIAKNFIAKKGYILLAAAGINIFLDILLIPFIGLYGISLATVAAHLFAFLMLSKGFLRKGEIILIIISSSMIPLVYYSNAIGMMLAVIDIAVLLKINFVSKEDIKIILNSVKNLF